MFIHGAAKLQAEILAPSDKATSKSAAAAPVCSLGRRGAVADRIFTPRSNTEVPESIPRGQDHSLAGCGSQSMRGRG